MYNGLVSKRAKSFKKWNRSKDKTEHPPFFISIYSYFYSYEDWDYSWWMWGDEDEYPYDYRDRCYRAGYVSDTDEYHRMKVLTLLGKLNIRTAKTIVEDRGW